MNLRSARNFSLKFASKKLIILSALLFSCLKDVGEKDPCASGQQVSYVNNVLPIITNSCAQIGCHTALAPFGDFTNYAGVKAKVDDGSFNKRTFEQKNMPIGSTLSQQDLNQLKCWIKNGAKNN